MTGIGHRASGIGKWLNAVRARFPLAVDPVVAGAIAGLALALLIAATARAADAPDMSLPHDIQVRALQAKVKYEHSRAEALRAFTDLIKTSVGLAWLNAEGAVRDRALELSVVEQRARDFCGQFPGMAYDPEAAQCSLPKIVESLRAAPSGEMR